MSAAQVRKQLLTMRETAKVLGVGRCTTLPELIRSGKLRTVSIAGHIRVPLDEIERVMREGTEAAPAARVRRSRAQSSGDREADALARLEIK